MNYICGMFAQDDWSINSKKQAALLAFRVNMFVPLAIADGLDSFGKHLFMIRHFVGMSCGMNGPQEKESVGGCFHQFRKVT
jgi:hypothetical protein